MEITLWKKEKKIWQYQNNSLTLHPNKKTKWKTQLTSKKTTKNLLSYD